MDIIALRPDPTFTSLINALNETKQGSLANLLEPANEDVFASSSNVPSSKKEIVLVFAVNSNISKAKTIHNKLDKMVQKRSDFKNHLSALELKKTGRTLIKLESEILSDSGAEEMSKFIDDLLPDSDIEILCLS